MEEHDSDDEMPGLVDANGVDYHWVIYVQFFVSLWITHPRSNMIHCTSWIVANQDRKLCENHSEPLFL